MKKVLVALLCTLSSLLPLTLEATTMLPVQNVQEVGENLIGMQPDACETGALGAVFEFVRDGVGYKLLILIRPQQSQHFILLSLSDGDNTPVWFGVIAEDGSIKVRKEMVYKDFLQLAEAVGGACGLLGRDV